VSILGNRVPRREDPAFLTGGDRYLENLPLDGGLRVVYVRSTVAHARITAVDTEAARSAPGVVAVFTAADIDLAPLPPAMDTMHQAMLRPWLADGVVRFVGEAVAAVVAGSWVEAVDAAELVFVDYDPLPAVVDPRAALDGETLLFREAGTNVVCELAVPPAADPGGDLFEGCEVVVRATLHNHRVAPCPLEVQAAACRWEPDGRLTQWSSTQTPHMVKAALAGAYGLAPEQVRVIAPDVGSAPSAGRTPRPCCCRGSPAGSAGPSGGGRPAPRAWWRWATAGRSARRSSSAAPGTGASSPTGSPPPRTAAPTR